MTPLLAPFDAPHGLPPFDRIAPSDFRPAFEAALEEHRGEIAAIRDADTAPDFVNTIEALERAGRTLDRVASVFFTLTSGDTTPELQEIEREVSPMLARHSSTILLDQALWDRVKAVGEQADTLAPEQARVTELTRRRFLRAGADLDAAGRARMAEIQERLAQLGTQFAQAVLADEGGWTLALPEAALAGLPASLAAAAEAEGRARGLSTPVVTLARSSVEPFLAACPVRDLREQAWRAWTGRGEPQNWPVIDEMLALRAELAGLLGHANFATHRLEDQMAKTPEGVRGLLEPVWAAATAKAAEEEGPLLALARADGIDRLEAWDWRYYAEQARQRAPGASAAGMEAYLSLENMIEAAFDVAGRLFGLSFEPLSDVPLPHPDARAWKVTRGDAQIGIFIGDYFARSSKRSGAWASGLRGQQKLWSPGTPVIMNTLNLVRGNPTLLSFDDARTLFHEFGHALHGLLSDVTYPSIAGTRVARDFVELPSQLYEHWLAVPAVLEAHARHYETGAPMPAEMIAQMKRQETEGQGFKTVEYLACAAVDLEMHLVAPGAPVDGKAIEDGTLARMGMPAAIAMRHRAPHFLHLFAGSGYAAGYYSYLWSEMMDADAFAAFEEAGSAFDAETARRLEAHVLSAGGRQEPEDAYCGFRGRMPGLGPLLEGRGLNATAAGAGAPA